MLNKNEREEINKKLSSEAESLISFLKKIHLDYNSIVYWEKLISFVLEKSQDFLDVHSLVVIIPSDSYINFYYFGQKSSYRSPEKLISLIYDRLKDKDLKLNEFIKKFEVDKLKDITNFNFVKISLAASNMSRELLIEDSLNYVLNELFLDALIVLNYSYRKDSIECRIKDKISANFLLAAISVIINSVLKLNIALEEINTKMNIDPLTGAYNKVILENCVNNEINKLNQSCIKNGKFSLAFIDLDDFKSINDIYGHKKGDEFLKRFSNIVKLIIRHSDIFSRVGGDEFVILFNSCSAESAKKILYEIKEKTYNELKLSFTAAIVEWPTHGKTYSELYESSDKLMLHKKKHSKGKIIIASEENISEISIVNKEESEKSDLNFNEFYLKLKEFLDYKNVVPYYQEIFDISKDPVVVGYEVLMRFKKDDLFISNVEKYIEFLEEIGKINIVGKMLVEKALFEISKFLEREENKNIFFSFNFSAQEIVDNRYISWFLSELKKKNVNNRNIVIELTERDTNFNSYLLIKNSKVLKSNKIKLGLDDFGKVHSSFCQLRFIDIDFIKLDKSIILEAMNNTKVLLFVESIRRYCSANNIILSAEGVESSDILDFLRQIEIKYAQGFYLGLPFENLNKN